MSEDAGWVDGVGEEDVEWAGLRCGARLNEDEG
jgi:hypothetical protein